MSDSEPSRPPGLPGATGRLAFELLIVFVGVWAALWMDNRREERDRQERALAIAEAMITEIDSLNGWFRGWRDTIDMNYAAWKERVARGERPPMFYFRMPGAEHPPKIGWDAGMAAGLLEVFDPGMVFDVGNFYHEWNDMGDRVARYHASTETLVFRQAAGDPSTAYLDDPRREPVVVQGSRSTITIEEPLRPEFAANLALMEEVLSELCDKFEWGEQRVRPRLVAAVAAARGGG